ncbi:MAG: chemotaxis protein CheW [Pseudomonadota bacterium]
MAITNEAATESVAESTTNQYLTFMLDGAEYGVDILRVQEIKGWDTATRIPNTPEFVMGVINLRGTVVPVIDLRRRFQLDPLEYSNTTVVVIVKVQSDAKREHTFGFVVDAVSEVYSVPHENIKPPPEVGTSVNIDFVKGLVTVDEKMLILLDIDNLVDSHMQVDEEETVH